MLVTVVVVMAAVVLLGLSGCLWLHVTAWVEWLPVVACGCLSFEVACGVLWLLEMSGCLSLPVAAWDEWLPVVACGCLG